MNNSFQKNLGIKMINPVIAAVNAATSTAAAETSLTNFTDGCSPGER